MMAAVLGNLAKGVCCQRDKSPSGDDGQFPPLIRALELRFLFSPGDRLVELSFDGGEQ